MNKSTSTRLGQILLDKGLLTVEQLDIAIKEQQKRRQLLDPFDSNLGVNSSLGEILIELGFIDRLQLRRGLNWQLMVRKMAIVMSFCAPLMTASYSAAAASPRPSFTANSSVSSTPKVTPSFTKTSSSSSAVPGVKVQSSSSVSSSSSRAASSSKSSIASKSSVEAYSYSGFDTIAPKMPEKISVSTSHDKVQLSWNDATDEAGVTRYKIYRDQVQIDTLYAYQTTYVDFNVAPGKTYLYGISAGDDAENWSTIKSVFAQTTNVVVASSSRASSISSISATSSSQAVVSSLPSNASSKAASSMSVVSSSKTASSVASSKSSTPPASTASSKSSVAVSSLASSASSVGSVVSSAASSSSTSSSSSSSSKAASSAATSSIASSANSSAGSSSGVAVAGPVNFSWTTPTLRENGNSLDITEVGGYELRYRKVSDNTFTYVTISDAWKNYYNFAWLDGNFLFQVAAFDKNGNYSNFVDITPQ